MARNSNAAFRALADQTRREILRLLRHGPLTSGDIAARFDSSWPTISRHLALLRDAGLVLAKRTGQEIYYELNTSVFQDLLQHLIEWIEPEKKRLPPLRTRRSRRHQEA